MLDMLSMPRVHDEWDTVPKWYRNRASWPGSYLREWTWATFNRVLGGADIC